MSPLDAQAGRLIRSIGNAVLVVERQRENSVPLSIFNGHDIERWLLKTMLAVYFAGMSNVSRKFFRLPSWWREAFLRPPAEPFGLYISTRADDGGQKCMSLAPGATVALLTMEDLLAGIVLSLHGLEFTLLASGKQPAVPEVFAYRPNFINLFEGQTVVSLGFAWDKSPGQTIWLSKDRNAVPPSNKVI